MSDIVVPANPDTLMVALRVKDAIIGFVREMLNGQTRPDEEPHFVDVREWTRENWRQYLTAIPVIGWRENGQNGMLPMVAGPVTQTLKTFYIYSSAEDRRGVFTEPFIKLGNSGYWDGQTGLIDERQVVAIWASSLHAVMLQIYKSGQPLISDAEAQAQGIEPEAPVAAQVAESN